MFLSDSFLKGKMSVNYITLGDMLGLWSRPRWKLSFISWFMWKEISTSPDPFNAALADHKNTAQATDLVWRLNL